MLSEKTTDVLSGAHIIDKSHKKDLILRAQRDTCSVVCQFGPRKNCYDSWNNFNSWKYVSAMVLK